MPPIGSFVIIPFGYKSQQVAHVEGHTRTGRVKVRAFNATRNSWMPGLRTVDAEGIKPAGSRSAGLPALPSAAS